MELKLKQITFPEVIEFNFSELKQEVTNRTAAYVGLVYTDDQIKDAKKDIAMLRKFTKALSDERIRVKKELMKPYEEFEGKIKELTGIVDNAISEIDSQLKSYEEKQKQEKLQNINEYMKEIEKELPEDVHIPIDTKWLNASVSMKSIKDTINEKAEQIKNDIATLSNLPEFSFEATEAYKSTLDLGKALNEAHRLAEIAKKKAEYEAQQKAREEEQARKAVEVEAKKQEEPQPVEQSFMNPPVEEVPAKQWISFSALLSTEDALALKAFFDNRQIEFKAI